MKKNRIVANVSDDLRMHKLIYDNIQLLRAVTITRSIYSNNIKCRKYNYSFKDALTDILLLFLNSKYYMDISV